MNHLTSPLETFNDQLKVLKPLFEEKMQAIEKKSEKLRVADDKIKELLLSNLANQIIRIDVGEKSYMTKLKTLLLQKDSIFYMQYYNEVETCQSLTTQWFFDRDNLFFSMILDFLRTGIVNIDSMTNDLTQKNLL